MIKYPLLFFLTLFTLASCYSQGAISITIDDVPNAKKYVKDDDQLKLLDKLDSLAIPIAIFINAGLIYNSDSVSKKVSYLKSWAKRPYVTLGNHTFNHLRYSDVDLDTFVEEVKQGEKIVRDLAALNDKNLTYFRFPFNDLGKDSIQHVQAVNFLKAENYVIAPYTVESTDWLFNYLYKYYLENGQLTEAERIGETYIETTLKQFDFFDSLASGQYGKQINHIYLCHDNSLNADYIDVLVHKLKKKGYSFTSIELAMEDRIYTQPDVYYKKWGVSWLYRWMNNSEERMALMRKEPENREILDEYNNLVNKKE